MTITYDSIATTTLSSPASTITFSGISNTFTDLRLVIVGNTTNASGVQVLFRFNSDTSALYSTTWIYGDGSSVFSQRVTGEDLIRGQFLNGSSGAIGLGIYDIFSYAGSTNKTVLIESSSDNNGSGRTYRMVGLYRSTSAITSIQMFMGAGSWTAGTTATLYGIKSE